MAKRRRLDQQRFADRTACHGPRPRTDPGAPVYVQEVEASFAGFREALICHFSYARCKRELRWLKAAADCRPLGKIITEEDELRDLEGGVPGAEADDGEYDDSASEAEA